MAFTRSEVQAFIDGFNKAQGDSEKIVDDVMDWLDKHPLYPVSKSDQAVILSDIESYRGVPKKEPVPVEQPPIEEPPV